MANFFAELKRRHIYRVGAAYVVAAWAVAQVIDLLSQVFALPPWIAQPAIIVIAVGFPIALVITWVVESKPQQVIASAVRSKPTTLDWLLFGAVAVLIALSGYRLIAPSSDTATRQPGVDAARSAATSPAGAISIAVLPFANLSGDAQQEFFSDGMTEEITAALAKIPDLRVVARTSAFQFRAQNRDIQSIGQQLHATHFIEGSVRKEGNRLRITAQLIAADNGTHIWAESYDRELTGVFAIQEDIARAITASLRMPLGLKLGENLLPNRPIDAESYQQYLRAKPLVRLRGRGVPESIRILEPLVQRNPNYAPALALLAASYGLSPNYVRTGTAEDLRRAVETYLPKAEAAAKRAIELEPNLPDGYLALGRVHINRGKFLLAEETYLKALALDENNPDALNQYGIVLSNVGRLKDSLDIRQKLRALEPFVPQFNGETAELLWLLGRSGEAIAMLDKFSVGDTNRASDLARVYASMGRFGEAADAMEKGSSQAPFLEQAKLLRAAPQPAASPKDLPKFGRNWFVYLYVGAQDRAMEYYEDMIRGGFFAPGGADNALLWHPSYSDLRRTERFKAFVRADGLIDYWRAKGWPDFCRPIGTDDFDCA